MDDDGFPGYVAGRLAELPGVEAVSLGGSRARGTHRPDSDWDFAIYYRGHFDPQTLRDAGWPGEVSELGGWGGGVFNGGAWLEIDHRRVDVHYRDLDAVDRELAEAREGRFRIEPLMFHLAGIPSYLVLAELGGSQVLRGRLPRPGYPPALRERAPGVWWDRAELTFRYARVNHAPYGRLAQCAGLIAQAASQAAHAVLAGRGEWVTNDKTLLTQAGLRQVDEFLAIAEPDPGLLRDAAERSHALCEEAVRAATGRTSDSGLACLAPACAACSAQAADVPLAGIPSYLNRVDRFFRGNIPGGGCAGSLILPSVTGQAHHQEGEPECHATSGAGPTPVSNA